MDVHISCYGNPAASVAKAAFQLDLAGKIYVDYTTEECAVNTHSVRYLHIYGTTLMVAHQLRNDVHAAHQSERLSVRSGRLMMHHIELSLI